MTCYLIPIGGTGVRVMKSIVYLCMAGCFDNVQFKVMCVDSDEVNGDIKELQKILKEYNDVSSDLFPEIKLNIINGKENCVWSPLSNNGLSTREKMRNMVNESAMQKQAKEILHFLYTDDELDKVLEGGFYGHTSIGSYFMAQQIVQDGTYTEVWKNFFDGINTDDKIFIIGSVFGGTGASGVPTIARLIKENSVTSSKPIGATFVMPYFKPIENDDELSELPIDWTTFTTKTKTALSFYSNQNFDQIFNTMYFIGEDSDKFMCVANNDCGVKQQNKANPIEVFAATSLLDFLTEQTSDTFVTKFLSKEIQPDNSTPLTSKMLNEIAGKNCYDRMAEFLDFSILYTKYLYPCIKDNYSTEKWYNYYKDIQPKDADALYQMSTNYMNWIKELIIDTDNMTGQCNYSIENNDVQWFHFKQYANLYDNTPLSSTEKGLLSKHKKYALDELNNLMLIHKNNSSSKTGSEIIIEFANDVAPNSKKRNDNQFTDLKRLMRDIIKTVKE